MTEQLAHVGVKGMKWGVRKNSSAPEVVHTKQLKNGGSVTISTGAPTALIKTLGSMYPEGRKTLANSRYFDLTDGSGKKVGNASFLQDTPDSLQLTWLGIKKSKRGNGYATAAMEGVTKYAQDKGLKKLTLEVPGVSPDARHIYTKMGFKATGEVRGDPDDELFGGLHVMVYDVPQTQLKQADLDLNELMDYIVRALDAMPADDDLSKEDAEFQMSSQQKADDFLAHYGVAGMKWGKRKAHQESRKEYKKRVRTERSEHDQKHLSDTINTSLRKGENVLIKTQLMNDFRPTIMTGKQFVEYASKGGLLNARSTDVFATLDKKQKQFVLNEPTAYYTPSERK